MKISYIALNRILEERAATDPEIREDLKRNGKVVLSMARKLSDDELLRKLDQLGFVIDREKMDQFSRSFRSPQELAEKLIAKSRRKVPERQNDWVWLALVCLWERWFPDRPNREMIDDRMQEGYQALDNAGPTEACRCWLNAWKAILTVMATHRIKGLAEFDKWFCGTQSLFNWVQDFSNELHNAGLDDPQFIRERIAFCQAVIEHSAGWTLSMDHFNLELAQSYFAIGDPRGEELFQRMLKEEPQWGWGWIGWADCYYLLAKESRDAGRAEAILKRGLAVPDVRDRKYLLERLEFLYEETGRTDQAKVVRRQIEEMQRPNVATQITSTGPNLQIKETFDFGEEGMPIEEFGRFAESMRAGRTASAERTPPAERSERVGRNDPCPCGSGKKFKRCCGRK